MSDTADITELMRAMRKEGWSDREIAANFGISRQNVHQKLGPRRPKAPAPENIDTTQLSTALRNWRDRHRLTQANAARRLHLANSTTLARWETEGGCALPGLVLDYIEMYNILTFLTAVYDNGSLSINLTVNAEAAEYIDQTMQKAKSLIDI